MTHSEVVILSSGANGLSFLSGAETHLLCLRLNEGAFAQQQNQFFLSIAAFFEPIPLLNCNPFPTARTFYQIERARHILRWSSSHPGRMAKVFSRGLKPTYSVSALMKGRLHSSEGTNLSSLDYALAQQMGRASEGGNLAPAALFNRLPVRRRLA